MAELEIDEQQPDVTEEAVESVTDEWFICGHPGYPDPIGFPTREKAVAFYWDCPPYSGSREGIRIRRRTVTRYEAFVPELREGSDG